MRRAHRPKGWWAFCFVYLLNPFNYSMNPTNPTNSIDPSNPMNSITQKTHYAERLAGFLFMDKNQKQWYFDLEIVDYIL
jgi:hypothetical protein